MNNEIKYSEMIAFKIAVQLEQLLKRNRDIISDTALNDVISVEHRLQNKVFRVAVVGEFNRGKSSFINVLLGKRILPEDVLATTATINRITYGEKPKAYLVFKDKKRKSKVIPVDELSAYITKLTSESERAAAEISEAVVEYPTMLCFNGVDLIDTPGMNDEDDMNAITVNRLEDIDLAIVAINAMYPFSETETGFVTALLESRNICQIIFVITHIDLVRVRDRARLFQFLEKRIKDKILEKLKKTHQPQDEVFHKYHIIFDNLRLYGISSLTAMEALESNNMELYENSGFLKLVNELPEIILTSQSFNFIDNSVYALRSIISECAEGVRSRVSIKDSWKRIKDDVLHANDRICKEIEHEIDSGTFLKKADELAVDVREKTLKRFLFSLGMIEEPTDIEIKKSLSPLVQALFKEINWTYKSLIVDYYEKEAKPALEDIVSVFANNLIDVLKSDKLLSRRIMQAGYDLNSLVTIEKLHSQEDINNPENRVFFYWVESPIDAIIDTEVLHSVIPNLQCAIDHSLAECRHNIIEYSKSQQQQMILRTKEIVDRISSLLDTLIAEEGNNTEKQILLQELIELDEQCKQVLKEG